MLNVNRRMGVKDRFGVSEKLVLRIETEAKAAMVISIESLHQLVRLLT